VPLADPSMCAVTKARSEMAGASRNDRIVALVEAAATHANLKTDEGVPLSAMPEGTVLHRVEFPQVDKDGGAEHVAVYLEFPAEFVEAGKATSFLLNEVGYEFVRALLDENVSGYFLYILDPKSGNWLEPDEIAPPEVAPAYVEPVDDATVEMARALGKEPFRDLTGGKAVPVINPGQPTGSLTGRSVFINPSHGWFDDVDFGRWRVQRTNTCESMEDFNSNEFISLYVMPMLRNAGAKVMTCRESDVQTNMVIVDNGDGTAFPARGSYVETGAWTTSSVEGFVQKTTASWTGTGVNPFSQGSGQNRLSPGLTTGAPTATATWVGNIPATGFYNVYVSWSPFSARAQDAQYFVHHSGGVTEFRMDQTVDGYTWVLLGNFHFVAGSPESERKVVLTNVSTDPDAVNVSADAVRWGGGMGDVARQTHGVSGRPRWEEEAVNYLQFTGFGRSGLLYTGTDDESGGWSDRPQYAQWETSIKDPGREDAVYFAWHTNAFNGTSGNCDGTARGLTTYRSSSASAASTTFQTIMHDKTYNAINTLWYTGETWTVRPKNVTNFGENNQTSMGASTAGFLYEGLFHDNASDVNNGYNDPRFRYIAARSIVQGVIDYFNQRDAQTKVYPPEPPVDFRVEMLGDGQAKLTWAAGPSGGFNGAAATGYRVQRSANGFGFDNGTAVAGTTVTFNDVPTSAVQYFRVVAVNAGGQSISTETLAAGGSGPDVLIVNGYDRNQRTLVPLATIANAGTVRRLDPRNFQAFNYVVEHAEALEPLGVRVSSACNEVVGSNAVPLGGYDAVLWIAGEESTGDEVVSATEQTRVSAYLSGGGKFLLSGSEVGWDLGRSGASTAGDIAFFNGSLHAAYVGDDANTYSVSGATGSFFQAVGAFGFATGSGARYDAEFPDTLAIHSGSFAAFSYAGGAVAGTAFDGGATKTVVLGFPFETIATTAQRATVMAKIVEFFDIHQAPGPDAVDAWMVR